MSATGASPAYDTVSTSLYERSTRPSGQTESLNGRVKAWTNNRPRLTDVNPVPVARSDEDVEFEPLGSVAASKSIAPAEENQWASATVLKVEAEFVTCEISARDRRWEVSLPRVFFAQQDVRYGTPVRIGIRDLNGYRTPVVEVVRVTPRVDPKLEALRAELLAL